MVSSEPSYDFLRFEIDGITQEQISGETGWQRVQAPLSPGPHLLRWGYGKDGTISAGQDAGFLDGVVLTGYAGWIIEYPVGLDTDLYSDPDRDGRAHAWEYLLGADPTIADAAHPHDLTVLAPPAAATVLTIGLVVRNDPAFALAPELSTNLLQWSPLGAEEVQPVSQIGVPAGFTRRAFRGPTPPPPSQHGRIRLRPAGP
jgi:hypothetical protein